MGLAKALDVNPAWLKCGEPYARKAWHAEAFKLIGFLKAHTGHRCKLLVKRELNPLRSVGHWRLERQLSEVEPPFIVLQRSSAHRPKLPLEIRPGNDCNGLVTGHRSVILTERQLIDFLSGRTRPGTDLRVRLPE